MCNVDAIPNQSGKIIIITGGTAGLGLASAVELYKKGAHVIITARSSKRGDEAVEAIRKAAGEGSTGKLEYGICDNENLHSMKEFASWFLAKGLPLHVLMLNAGVAFVPFKVIEGVESTMFINHVSHHLLTELLLPKLKESAPSRVVIVSSDAHAWVTKLSLETPDEKEYSGLKRYGESKLANIYFGRELQRRLGANSKVIVNMAHPGPVATNIAEKANAPSWLKPIAMFIMGLLMQTKETGALTQLYLATSPEIEAQNIRARYFVPVAKEEQLKAPALDEAAAAALWDWTEQTITRVLAAPPRPA